MSWVRHQRYYDANNILSVYLHMKLNLANQAKYFGGGGFGAVRFIRFAAKLSRSSHMMYLISPFNFETLPLSSVLTVKYMRNLMLQSRKLQKKENVTNVQCNRETQRCAL